MAKKVRQTFNPEFKREAVKLLEQRHKEARELGPQLNEKIKRYKTRHCVDIKKILG